MSVISWLNRKQAVRRAEDLLSECCQRLDLDEKALGRSGKDWVARRRWSEDAAEMRRYIYYAAICAHGETVEAQHFLPRQTRDHEALSGKRFEAIALEDIVGQKIGHFFDRMGQVEAHGVRDAVMAQVERPLIRKCLEWAGGNKLKAARVLGMDRNTLAKRIREYGL
jgi:two-component system nitrogen regulation response regulator GlnG